MPNASVPNHQSFEDFLKSDQKQMVYRFNSIKEAREFADTFNGIKDEYSTQMETGGIGTDCYVTIEKTEDYFNNLEINYSKYKDELQKIKSYTDLHQIVLEDQTCIVL
jgi:hypothetical protein